MQKANTNPLQRRITDLEWQLNFAKIQLSNSQRVGTAASESFIAMKSRAETELSKLTA